MPSRPLPAFSGAAFLAALALCVFTAVPARAQTPCEGGFAGNYPCEGVDLLANLPLSTFGPVVPSRGNDIWGWTDPQTGREYALVGLTNGTAFVDVTEPTAPVYLGKLPTATDASTWRDIKVYADHAFVVADNAGSHGLQVFDLTRLRDVASPPVTFTHDARFTGFGSAHNLAIDTESGFAYVVGSFQCSGGLYIVDVRDPLNPVEAGCYPDDGYSHDAQCVTYAGPDPDHQGKEICVGSNENHIVIVDVEDKANPEPISRGFYPEPWYTHQGWFTEDFRYFLVDDELDDSVSPTTRTLIFNVEDLDNPEFAFTYFGPIETTDHNLYIRGNHAFLSNYEGGLRILDLSGIDDGTLVEVGSFDTYPQGNGESYDGQWSNYPFFASGTIIANDRDNGLFVLQTDLLPSAAEPSAPQAHTVLSAPVPNPADGRSTLTLTVPEPVEVVAEVLDLRGRRVALLYEGPAAPSAPLVLAVDGADLPAGLYLVRVTGPDFTATRRLSLVH